MQRISIRKVFFFFLFCHCPLFLFLCRHFVFEATNACETTLLTTSSSLTAGYMRDTCSSVSVSSESSDGSDDACDSGGSAPGPATQLCCHNFGIEMRYTPKEQSRKREEQKMRRRKRRKRKRRCEEGKETEMRRTSKEIEAVYL